MADVFISYKRQDKLWAELVDARLRSAALTTWWDASLTAGDAFTEVIRSQLAAARVVVVLWSSASWTSRWVQAEAADALGRDILVCARTDGVVVGVPFNILQVADLRTPTGLEDVLVGVQSKIAGRPAGVVAIPASPEGGSVAWARSVLGVSETAGFDEAKRAFRKLAMKLHPDRDPGDKEAEERFAEVCRAFELIAQSNSPARPAKGFWRSLFE